MLVTTAETEHDAPGGTTVAEATTREATLAVAKTLEFAQVVEAKGDAELVIPGG
jgi:hypothetical protein